MKNVTHTEVMTMDGVRTLGSIYSSEVTPLVDTLEVTYYDGRTTTENLVEVLDRRVQPFIDLAVSCTELSATVDELLWIRDLEGNLYSLTLQIEGCESTYELWYEGDTLNDHSYRGLIQSEILEVLRDTTREEIA